MLTVKLPSDMERRLETVAAKIGRTKDDIVLAAIVEEIQDLEEGLIALERMQDGEAQFFAMEEVRERLGLTD